MSAQIRSRYSLSLLQTVRNRGVFPTKPKMKRGKLPLPPLAGRNEKPPTTTEEASNNPAGCFCSQLEQPSEKRFARQGPPSGASLWLPQAALAASATADRAIPI